MRWLVRFKNSPSAANAEIQDRELSGPSLLLGKGVHSDIVLASLTDAQGVKLRQGKKLGKKQCLLVESVSAARVLKRADGQSEAILSKRCTLALGEACELAGHIISSIEVPAGFDMALQIELPNLAPGDSTHAFEKGPFSLAQAGIKMRPWAWLLMLVMFVVGLALPLAKYMTQGEEDFGVLAWADHIWSPGRLADVHHISGLADNCQSCHSSLFEPVKDEDCQHCHSDMAEHLGERFSFTTSADSTTLAPAQEPRCAECHIEHKTPSLLNRQDELQCTECHQVSITGSGGQNIAAVASFDAHPAFKLSILEQLSADVNSDKGSWQYARIESVQRSGLKEASNLKFPHDLHLLPEGIDGPKGREVLACSNCHLEEQDGKGMQDIGMEQDCSRCHSLAFEPTDPDTQLPHASLNTVKVFLEQYYARQYAVNNGPPSTGLTLERAAKRPGKPPRDFYAAMAVWSDQKAESTLSNLVKLRACATCHSINTKPKNIEDWRIEPVKITPQWYHAASFDHSAHQTFSAVAAIKLINQIVHQTF